MDAEQIVRALAAQQHPSTQDWPACAMCESFSDDPSRHEPDCPWRLAREWVAEHPA